MKEYMLRDIKDRITRDFRKSIDAEDVSINGVNRLVLITRDKGDEQIKKIKSLPDERFDLGDIVNWNGVNYIIYKMFLKDKTNIFLQKEKDFLLKSYY